MFLWSLLVLIISLSPMNLFSSAESCIFASSLNCFVLRRDTLSIVRGSHPTHFKTAPALWVQYFTTFPSHPSFYLLCHSYPVHNSIRKVYLYIVSEHLCFSRYKFTVLWWTYSKHGTTSHEMFYVSKLSLLNLLPSTYYAKYWCHDMCMILMLHN